MGLKEAAERSKRRRLQQEMASEGVNLTEIAFKAFQSHVERCSEIVRGYPAWMQDRALTDLYGDGAIDYAMEQTEEQYRLLAGMDAASPEAAQAVERIREGLKWIENTLSERMSEHPLTGFGRGQTETKGGFNFLRQQAPNHQYRGGQANA